MKLKTLFLLCMVTSAGVYGAAPVVKDAATAAHSAHKKIHKANIILALKAAGFAGLGYYLGGYAYGYLKTLVQMLPKTGYKNLNTSIENVFNRAVGPTIGILGIYALMRSTGNVSQFDDNDIDAGFMGTAGGGREAAKAA